MALTQQVSLENNFGETSTFPDAYIKINEVQVTKTVSTAYVWTMSSKDGQVLTSKPYQFTADLEGENHLRQGYLHLKTLPEFADATDC
jgi:hypothetical protein